MQGNLIGTDVTGAAALGNGNRGVFIPGGSGNTIGGTTAAARNIISANDRGIQLNGSDHFVQGNYIGTDITGTLAFPNRNEGVNLDGATGVLIGGLTSTPGTAPGNLISGNTGVGVDLFAGVSNNNQIQGNIIGADITGVNPLGNSLSGILINGSNNLVGGTSANARNIIAFNGTDVGSRGSGIAIANNTSFVGNALLGNSIFGNTKVGIDLVLNTDGNDGITPNDAGDADTGANNLQNFPVLTSVTSVGGMTTIQGTLNSLANTSFRIEFFSSTTADPSGNGEGQTFLGFVNTTTVGNDATFTFSTPTPAGTVFTATATRLDASSVPIETSEFSAVQTVNVVTTTTVLTSSPDPSNVGQSVTFTATVTANPPSSLTPAGSVTFVDTQGDANPANDVLLGTDTLDAQGVASISTNALTAGLHTILASFTDAAGNFATSSGTDTQQVDQVAAATTTTLVSSDSSSIPGQTVTFTATVSTQGAGIPTGTVTFKIDAGGDIVVPLNSSGQAAFSTSTLTVGMHTITADYTSNSSAFSNSSAPPLTQTVSQVATTTTLVSSDSNSDLGQQVTFTATVTVPEGGVPTGTVTFKIDGGGDIVVPLNVSGQAQFSTSTLSVGPHTITADYTSNSAVFTNSSAPPLTQTVIPPAADLSITKVDGPDPIAAGANLTYTIRVTNAGPAAAQSVTLSDLIPANTTFVSFVAPAGWTPTTPTQGGTGTVTATNPKRGCRHHAHVYAGGRCGGNYARGNGDFQCGQRIEHHERPGTGREHGDAEHDRAAAGAGSMRSHDVESAGRAAAPLRSRTTPTTRGKTCCW